MHSKKDEELYTAEFIKQMPQHSPWPSYHYRVFLIVSWYRFNPGEGVMGI